MMKIKKRRNLKNNRHLSRKNLENPFLSKKAKKNRLNRKKRIPLKYKLYFLVVIVAVAAGGWFFFFCPVWTIETVEIQGVTRTSEQEIKKTITDQQHNKKLFFLDQKQLTVFDGKALKEKLNSLYRFEKVSIDKVWPDKLTLIIQEKPYAYIWKEADQYYYADENSYILKRMGHSDIDLKNNEYPVITDQNGNRVADNRINIENKYIEAVLVINEHIKEDLNEFIANEFIITKEMNTLKFTPQKGPYVLFDIDDDIENQINNLVTLKNKLKEDIFHKKYIDLRYGDRIYYR